ncbi:MAG: nucleotidyltransferase domain-containing protein [Pseudonocardiaceae bacterium]
MNDFGTETLVQLIREICAPVSIFLYGSRARGDHLPDSDFEVGVLLENSELVGRKVLESCLAGLNVRAYPFVHHDFRSGRIDTPFRVAIYLRELHLSAKTIFGEPVVERLVPPPITTLDALQDIRFSIGRAMSALLADRFNEHAVATQSFYKSCLLGVRMGVLAQLGEFPLGYDDIANRALTICPQEYGHVVEAARIARSERTSPPVSALFYMNIQLLTRWVEPLVAGLHPAAQSTVLLA